ncbi:hypothetical protein KEM60_02224 [Austwickia sp. TVS 96-490-7B]|uniref:ABC transporter permease n=1 Tax=Austwickia sp. TVS 96-490-7B TaxID=2830843 RepID=UPI001C5A31F8|nr:ABC transporter permease [Austwickia sp. TVS 96-490-7B]MBW3086013.1 hypothetical protein [Austwickia sp. TVS 96-490-7B]
MTQDMTQRQAEPVAAVQEEITGVSFARLVQVEARKIVDTRSGRWFLGVLLALVLLVLTVLKLTAKDANPVTFTGFFTPASEVLKILVPVLGILTMTSEWQQRTAMVTFTLEPRRGRVLLAKALATFGVIAILLVITALLAALCAALFSTGSQTWKIDAATMGKQQVPLVLSVLMGMAFGLLLSNSALAITLYFVLPMMASSLLLFEKTRKLLEWAGPSVMSAPWNADSVTTQQWQQAMCSMVVWLIVPMIIGTIVTLRREVK